MNNSVARFSCQRNAHINPKSGSAQGLTGSSLVLRPRVERKPSSVAVERVARALRCNRPFPMLPRKLRLSRQSFPHTASLNKRQGKHLTLVYGKATKGGGCAVVVSKKISKSAVERHAIKRRLLATLLPSCRNDRFLIIYARTGCAETPRSTLSQELKTLLTEASLLS